MVSKVPKHPQQSPLTRLRDEYAIETVTIQGATQLASQGAAVPPVVQRHIVDRPSVIAKLGGEVAHGRE